MCFNLAGIGNVAAAHWEAESAKQAATYNAAQLEEEAKQTILVAKANEERQRTESSAIQAQSRANIGASGVQMEGSPLEVLAFNAGQQELAAMQIRYEGEREAWKMRTGADVTKWQGKQAQVAGGIKATTAALSVFSFSGGSAANSSSPQISGYKAAEKG